MPDIAMCKQHECPLAKRCYRYTATPSEFRQTYFSPKFTANGCEYYWYNNSPAPEEPTLNA